MSLPARSVHPEGECNEEMISILNEYILITEDEANERSSEDDDEEDIDPRWAELNKLK